jgi:DNA-binding FrmR family transcriptional regulator
MVKDPTVSQLNRIRGQVDGISKMYQEQRPCIEIARQLAAVRSSLAKVARTMLAAQATTCSKNGDCAQLDLVLKELLRY